MKKISSPIIITALFIFIFCASAFAENPCRVPVCDIPAEILALKNMSQSEKFKRVSELRLVLKTATDLDTFINLRDFAIQARELFIALKEEDWVIREPGYLIDDSVQKILITKEPNFFEMKENFQMMVGEGSRYSVLNFWSLAVQKMENTQHIKELLGFSEFAEKYCTDLKDSDYVPREAFNLRKNATARYMVIYPTHEGVYEISGPNFLPNRLIIVETMTSSGLLAVFSNTKSGGILYGFPGLRASGDLLSLEATNTDTTIARSLNMQVNVLTGDIAGVIRDSRGIEPEQIWTGKRIVSPIDLFPKNGRSDCNFSDNVRWEGTLGTYEGVLNIRKIHADKYSATFTSKSEFIYRIDFSVIHLRSQGIIYLTYNGSNGSFLKITLACDGTKWNGMGFSTMGGAIFSTKFQEIK